MDSLRGTREAGKDSLDSLRSTREAGKDHLDSLQMALWRHQGGTIGRQGGSCKESRQLDSSTAGWRQGRQEPPEPFGQPGEAPGRHQGGKRINWTACEAPGRQERTIWTAWEAPGKQESINWTACEAPRRHQGGRKEPFAQPGRHQGGTQETRSTGLPIESGSWRGAGVCITFTAISMAIGLVRGKSWGGPHGRLPVAQAGL